MSAETYLDNTGRDDILGGGARRIPITTTKGELSRLDQALREQPHREVAAPARRPGLHP